MQGVFCSLAAAARLKISTARENGRRPKIGGFSNYTQLSQEIRFVNRGLLKLYTAFLRGQVY